MRDVYQQNPKLGDAATLTKQLEENSHAIDQLRTDISKYEVFSHIHCDSFHNTFNFR